jgi:hypothetical protein
MTKRKPKWTPLYNGDGNHVATMNGTGECKSLGHSPEDSPPEVVVEIRAAELALNEQTQTDAEELGYEAHLYGTSPPDDGWAGWLERAILVHDLDRAAERRKLEDPNWQDRVHEACDEVDAANAKCDADNELLASAARGGPFWGVNKTAPDPRNLVGLSDFVPTLDSVDQSDPTPAPEVPLHDVHSDEEATHVGDVDERFDRTEGL